MVRTKVFVGNLSFQTKEAELATEFAVAGKVISANIITRGPRSLGYGFVEFDSEEDAQNAVKLLSKKEINGRAVNVEIAKPQDETKRQPRPPRPEGENGASRRPRPRKSFRKKEGEEGEKKPSEENKKEEEEEEEEKPRRRIRPRRPRRIGGNNSGERRVPNEEREESKTTLFVANLPFSLDDVAFAKIVTDLNLKLKSAHVVKKRNGRSKGYGFIEFDSQDDQQKALAALNKKVVDSRELSVKVALTEIKHESAEQKEAKPVENKVAAPEKKTAPVEKKSVPAEKKSSPAPVAEKKSSPAPVAEKKVSPAPEKKASPAPEKKASPAPQEKKTPSTEKKPEAKTPEKEEKKK
jgi:RNA recognition motif-containing protein